MILVEGRVILSLETGMRPDFLNGQVSQNDHFFQEQLSNIAERNSTVRPNAA